SSSTPGVSFSWTATVPPGIVGAGGILITSGTDSIPVQTLLNPTNTPLAIVYSTTATAACPGLPYFDTLVVNPIPFALANPPSYTLCSGDTTQLILSSSVAGTTFSWTVNV